MTTIPTRPIPTGRELLRSHLCAWLNALLATAFVSAVLLGAAAQGPALYCC